MAGFISGIRTTDTTFSTWGAPGTTIPLTTSYNSTEVDVSGWGFGIFQTYVTSNIQGNPIVRLQQRLNTTNWISFATIHPDMTTTENGHIEEVMFHGDYLRVSISPEATTTLMCSFSVIAKIKGVE